ncbi:MAG: putative toxin-antitoxin system toxin component, PIN family [Gaiellaceae bacterium]
MKVVVDTNVLVSALIFPGGAPEAVYRLALDGRIDLATSRPLLAELGRVLTDTFGWDDAHAEAAVALLIGIAQIVDPDEGVTEIDTDPADNRVLEAALADQAEAIVSGDGHLLALRSWRGIPIEPPAAFLRRPHGLLP